MGFKNLKEKQERLKESLKNPIIEFKKTEKTIKIKRNIQNVVVFIISDSSGDVILVGRATRNLSEAFSKFALLHESDTLELFPFTREDAAVAFYRRILYHFNPKFNCERKISEVNEM